MRKEQEKGKRENEGKERTEGESERKMARTWMGNGEGKSTEKDNEAGIRISIRRKFKKRRSKREKL